MILIEVRFVINMDIKNYIGLYLLFVVSMGVLLPILSYYYVSDKLIRSFIYLASSGGLGAIVYCIRSFYTHVVEQDFSKNWIWWYIFRPFLGCIVGIFTYFVLGGLMSLNSSELNFNFGGLMAYCAMSFLAGFCFTEFMNKLEKINEVML